MGVGMKLNIWGVVFELVGDKNGQHQELLREFSGSCKIEPEKESHYQLIFVDTNREGIFGERIVRHKGGSGNNKYFTNGEVFDVAEQLRFVDRLSANERGSMFLLDGIPCFSSRRNTYIFSTNLTKYLLADIVENILLNHARKNAWVHAHGAAWVEGGQIDIVIGESGAGKTTTLFKHVKKGAKFISNDRVFLRVNKDQLEARGFPLPVNMGCGTIRFLELDYETRGKEDSDKIRLSAQEISEIYMPDYDSWYPVSKIFTTTRYALDSNIYWQEDECHPNWNPAQAQELSNSDIENIRSRVNSKLVYGKLL